MRIKYPMMYSTYKVTMYIGKPEWTVMQDFDDYRKALNELESYRNVMKDRKFRLERHDMMVLDEE